MEYWVQQFDVDGCHQASKAQCQQTSGKKGASELRKSSRMSSCLPKAKQRRFSKRTISAMDSPGQPLSKRIPRRQASIAPGEKWTAMRDKMPVGTLFLRNLENHDISMDLGENRWNRIAEPDLVGGNTPKLHHRWNPVHLQWRRNR